MRLELIGGFQAANALVAAGLAIGAGSDPAAVIGTLPALRTVRGRMERAATRANGAQVFVDYAHTPDALTTALTALRPHVMGRLLVVFGAGGDRDRGKRPLMGRAAARAADVVFVTDDNPRTEDAGAIRAAVREGAPEATEIGDRAEAILTAVDALQPGRRAAHRRQGPRDRAGDRPGHPALRRHRAGERRRRRPRRDGRVTAAAAEAARRPARGAGVAPAPRGGVVARGGLSREDLLGKRLMKRLLHQGASTMVGLRVGPASRVKARPSRARLRRP